MWDGSGLEVLDRQECLDLVTKVPVGRLVFTDGALPAVHPVNFRLHDGHVIFRVAPGSKLTAALSNSIVAFQVDQLDMNTHDGWTVTIIGRTSIVPDIAAVVTVSGTWLCPWRP